MLPINGSQNEECQRAVHARILEGADIVNFMGIPRVKTPDNRGRECSCEFCLCVAGSNMDQSVQIARGVTMLTSAHPASTPTQHSTCKSALQVSLHSKSKSHSAALFQCT